jgi:hypothetical protein
MNYGYRRVKGDPVAVSKIPEVEGCPELGEFLVVVNATESPIESVGCEKCCTGSNLPSAEPQLQHGSYVDLIFTETALNAIPENHLLLSCHLLKAVEGSQSWWSTTQIELQRLKCIEGADCAWNLLLRVIGFGRTEEQARKLWGESLRRLTAAVKTLSSDFRWTQQGVT